MSMSGRLLLIYLASIKLVVSTSSSCSSVLGDVKFGPQVVIRNLTQPEFYDYSKRPNLAFNPSTGISKKDADIVYVSVVLNSIERINQIQQTIVSSLVEKVEWNDHRLAFNTTREGSCIEPVGHDVETDAIPLEIDAFEGVDRLIWTPSVNIVNIVTRQYGKSYALVYPNGDVFKAQRQQATTTCPLHFGKYPFDTHTCYIDMGTFMHSHSDLYVKPGLKNRTRLVDLSTLEKYNVGQFQVSQRAVTYDYIGDDGEYVLRGEFDVVRAGQVFMIDILLPEILLHISLYASFWIPADSAPARVSLCIISALSFRIMRTSISESLPPVSYSVWVVDYMACSQAIAVLALIEFAVIAYLLFVEQEHMKLFDEFKKTKIPGLIRKNPAKAVLVFKVARTLYDEFESEAEIAGNQSKALMVKRKSIFSGSIFKTEDERKTTEKVEETSIDFALQSFEDNESGSKSDLFDFSARPVGRTSSGDDLSDDQPSKELPKIDEKKHVVPKGNKVAPPNVRMSTNGRASISGRPRSSQINEDQQSLLKSGIDLTIPEVMTIAFVRNAFKTYDLDSDGCLCIHELQQCLRHFGKYYSTNQCCALVAAYRQSQGSTLGQVPTLNLADFFCILVELDKHEPLAEFVKLDYSTIPPSHRVDLVARVAYPFIVLIKIAIFFLILDTVYKE